jgi:hypothetical protein
MHGPAWCSVETWIGEGAEHDAWRLGAAPAPSRLHTRMHWRTCNSHPLHSKGQLASLQRVSGPQERRSEAQTHEWYEFVSMRVRRVPKEEVRSVRRWRRCEV